MRLGLPASLRPAVFFSLLMPSCALKAQIAQPFNTDRSVAITVAAPPPQGSATVEVFSPCAGPARSSLRKPASSNSVSGEGNVTLELAAPLVSGQVLCAVETSTTAAGVVTSTTLGGEITVRRDRPDDAPPAASVMQLEPAFAKAREVVVDPIPAPAGTFARLDVFAACPSPGHPQTSLLAPGLHTADSTGAPVALTLLVPLKNGDRLCATETIAAQAAPPPATATVADPPAAPVIPPTPPDQVARTLEAQDQALRAKEQICTRPRDTACLASLQREYASLLKSVDDAEDADPALQPASGQHWSRDAARLRRWNPAGGSMYRPGDTPPGVQCRIFASLQQPPSGTTIFNQGCFSLSLNELTGNVTHARLIAGVDISGASSADPAAKFLGEAALDVPLPARNSTTPLYARNWLFGYLRIGSIAQPTTSSGQAALSSSVSALFAKPPNQIIQSFETAGGYEFRAYTYNDAWGRRPLSLSILASGGLITPISNSQEGLPAIYIATSALKNFYDTQQMTNPSTFNKSNQQNIDAACPTSSSSASFPTCYIVQYQQDREHFFRNYAAGLRLKRYYYNEDNQSFIFPSILDFTIGQDEYVTGGELHRFVAHLGGSTPIASSIAPGLYAYAAFDLVLTKNAAVNQQFPLQTAGSAITTASGNVAQIAVLQPDRDRYRFGIAIDVATLKKLLSSTPK